MKNQDFNNFIWNAQHILNIPSQNKTLFQITQTLKSLLFIERRLHFINEAECNGELTATQSKREDRLRLRAENLAKEIQIYITFQGDPRGGSIKFFLSAEDRKKSNNPFYI